MTNIQIFKTVEATFKRKSNCSNCGSGVFAKGENESGAIWICTCCDEITNRKIRMSARQKRVKAILAKLEAN